MTPLPNVIAASLTAAFAFILLLCSQSQAAHQSHAEFSGMCVTGLAAGKRVQTNCSVSWQDEGKAYCFSNEDAKATFLKDPQGTLAKAKENFALADAPNAEMAMAHFTSADAQALVDDVIKRAAEKNGGIYPLKDALTGQTVPLVYDKIDFTRTIHGYGFFPDVIFHAKDDAAKQYLVDFWVRPEGGKLSILDVRIYKAPKKEGTTWIMMTRQPKPWWWIPASEHPGESEVKRGWEVMSAIESHILGDRSASEGTFKLKDDKTGEEITLEFVGLHQPVRRLKENGRFFACSDFRKEGTTDQFYDVDFWLDEKDGTLKVTEARIHKVPVLEDGSYTQVPRYSFDPQTFDVVP
jgi:hypothetical protein